MPTLSAHFFTWSKGHGTADFSDLLAHLKEPMLEGFKVAGRRETKTFNYTGPKRDSEGEVEFWSYVSEDKKFRITVFND